MLEGSQPHADLDALRHGSSQAAPGHPSPKHLTCLYLPFPAISLCVSPSRSSSFLSNRRALLEAQTLTALDRPWLSQASLLPRRSVSLLNAQRSKSKARAVSLCSNKGQEVVTGLRNIVTCLTGIKVLS